MEEPPPFPCTPTGLKTGAHLRPPRRPRINDRLRCSQGTPMRTFANLSIDIGALMDTSHSGTTCTDSVTNQEQHVVRDQHSKVFLGNPVKGIPVAIKRIHANTPERRMKAAQETEAHKAMKHKNIPRILEVHQDEKFIYLIMEYVDGADLFQVLEDREYVPFREADIREFLFRVSRAIYYCHRNGYSHGDIKLENIMVDSSRTPRLIDFGLSTRIKEKDKLSSSFSGTSDYACPQILLTQPYIQTKADVWALGVVIFTVVTGHIPFCRDQKEALIPCGQHPQILWRQGPTLSKEFKQLMEGMLKIDQNERLSMGQVVRHSWFAAARRAEFIPYRSSVRGSINVL
ncbi:sperm motility kinase Y [Planoprotostelium fungivorum]|uniref:non-specific serine/threonine protein kinase n=1 Tax=Planoprotostelium fungivorum TaxID=1890364 RepID=A0A2P6N133_9EUKA|nr:sperm motility kinase Y [Planoprotostelium fungivorum]